MSIYYKSTRDDSLKFTASEAILQGLSEDGGLFVPDHIPALPIPLEDFSGLSYQEVAYLIMKEFFSDFTEEELKSCIQGAYDTKFDTEEIAPLHEACGAYFLELFHGKTIAFKDMALSILPYLMKTSAKKQGEGREIVILTATSGDTGKAAMAGFADVPGTRIAVFYPKDGVSPLQELQMRTQKASNVRVIGINGNFDNAQTGVKLMLSDQDFKDQMASKGFRFSSANSINIGRLVPQVVYYVYAYSRLVSFGKIKSGDEINITVPTGNFGNILAAYYARLMGLPVKKLICASNSNKVLFDFFETGTYDRMREFHVTMSPSMDILISSNLERLIFMISGENKDTNCSLMEALSKDGKYTITEDMKSKISTFYGGYATEEETKDSIKSVFKDASYLIDPHTAVAFHVYNTYKENTGDNTPTVIASTASPYKFTGNVMTALGEDIEGVDDLTLCDRLREISGVPLPSAITELKGASLIHNRVCDVDKMRDEIEDFLK